MYLKKLGEGATPADGNNMLLLCYCICMTMAVVVGVEI